LSQDDFYTPTDIDMLRMENELLSFEVRFLRSRLGWSAVAAGPSSSLSRISYLEEAETDLILLLRRLGNSPAGPLLRRRKNFRIMEENYLRAQDTQEDPMSPGRIVHLEAAEKDLVLLLRRLNRTPAGPLLRRRRSFRTLLERYL
jgi:hypothetical protein